MTITMLKRAGWNYHREPLVTKHYRVSKLHFLTTRSHLTVRSNIRKPNYTLFLSNIDKTHTVNIRRNYGVIVTRVIRSIFKLRYVIFGGVISGGVTLNSKYTEWKENLPDFQWIQDVLPDPSQWQKLNSSLVELTSKFKDSLQDTFSNDKNEYKLHEIGNWFGSRLYDAIEAAEEASKNTSESSEDSLISKSVVHAHKIDEDPGKKVNVLQSQIDQLQVEIMNIQLKYQKELEKLEKENRELRQQFLILKTDKKYSSKKKFKKSLIDLYSEVLDELSGYDTSYSTADHLPRVVVVGDQSSGKTSVLEAIAQARIFPRGSGEMMTRAPVKVTLSEGPYHVAQFKDSNREFDLSKENELAELRREVEVRMRNSVKNGKTVSREVISMSVKGPGLQRMVLVDLPGIISTQTTDMASDTREMIKDMTSHYMNNPNAIILCIQDGSVDAERSIVTELVKDCDPTGKRTIFVLTKVDMAEELADPDRLRKILSGKLFPMKAIGYFAVVTGRGRKDDNISTIRDYEEKFFKSSKLFQKGGIHSHQCTTRNLSLAVADRFWKMVRETIEQQADAFKATRFNLETEWKNNFPRVRETSRDELYEKAKGEILDEVVNLSQVSAKNWEDALNDKLWEKLSTYIFENIYLPAAQTGSQSSFNTMVDIKLKQWADEVLPVKSVEVGWETLQEQFTELIEKSKKSPEHDDIFDNLKYAVIDESIRRHSWEDKAIDVLRVIQVNALEDTNVHDKHGWDGAVKFCENSIREKLQQTENVLSEMFGPSVLERWVKWKTVTEEQFKRKQIKQELDRIIQIDVNHPPSLSYEELTSIVKSLKRNNIETDTDYIREIWYPLYRRNFLKKALLRANDCKKSFYLYSQQGTETEVNCNDIILFYRIQKVLRATSNALRQQIINREARRLDKEIKDVLDEFGEDDEKKVQLIAGKRVNLAEALIKVRHIQDKLEEFISALNLEK